jgi:hypothetical protein
MLPSCSASWMMKQFTRLSSNGDEVAFATIGNASSAEGLF